ncbi:ABC-2 type transport system permease protein [Amycolatopsis bartoniae]|uniref:Exporter of polyketide antibiotics n=1 Tax=Amycolatopsis bartoniae TaxID=941986 RepID=A0A8H9MEB0_9PSEU|nr:ABC transporter permease [Amycolatopsis bartoniae]MBB2933494.1 ABC-2 type transport system permease protein [Amycolatopsis bartoniae]TVT07597.1 ABC transporter permease [Amycolatopsis bartoniae]GHF59885.1 exporter of polyketide antibiotics [Amycolatopsis bartoniae]
MNPLAGTGQLVRLALRRDRVVVPVWVLVLGVLPAAIAATYEQFYPDAASRSSLTTGAAANPSVTLLYGPAFDLSTAGGFTAWRILAFLSLFTALACVFTVTRHTRQEEDTGRQELLSSAVLGRFAALTAALLVAGAAALTTGLVAVITLVATGMPAAGSVAFGLGIASTGWVFSAVAAVTAQLVEYSRTANGLASAVLGLAFLVRGVGDSAKDVSWLSWLSPLGWAPQLRAFAGERWAVVLLPLAATVVLCGLAYGLLPRRDVGLSIFPSRPGPATAAPGLRSPLALAWRLHRGTLTGWLVGFAVMGAVLGSLASGIGGLVGDSPQIRQVFERMGGTSALVDSYLGAIAGIFGMVAAVFAVQANLRMRSEETGFRLEPLLATPVRRLRWAASHLVFSLLGSALLLVVAGVAAGLLHGLRVGDVGGQVPRVLGATVAQLPAVWVVAGISVLLFGIVPKAATAGWSVASLSLAIALYGPALRLPQAVLDVSPFTHVPKLPTATLTVTPLVWLSGIALIALVAGLAGFRRRDIG